MGYLRAYREQSEPEPDGTMTFVASTAGVKRDGLEINQERWRLDDYRANPVVLYAHDYTSLPIGRADVVADGESLRARVAFDMEDEFAASVYGKYQRGMLNAVSVGWRDVGKGSDVWHELLDVSAVPVPGDPQALAERTRAAIRTMADWLRDSVEPDHKRPIGPYEDFDACVADNQDKENPEAYCAALEEKLKEDNAERWPSWEDVATEMVDVFARAGEMPEAERERRYRTLLPLYRHHHRVAPEWLDAEDVIGVDLGSLMLEGEMDVAERAGAVLNARNRERLAQIKTLAQEVLDSAAKPDDAAEEKPEKNEDTERAVLARILEELDNGNA